MDGQGTPDRRMCQLRFTYSVPFLSDCSKIVDQRECIKKTQAERVRLPGRTILGNPQKE